ncbi:hypothetical protein [Schumannella soli]|uniref:Uncharacterized protein n=1 Tax=Schumannella soli TaxID=2590779 RepID=A0A506Y7M2_9MICO|nr:hypothetical protein [Schumannella soli]TPW78092.1 hypothetical protein FJ657_05555 [Schumannella soli]
MSAAVQGRREHRRWIRAARLKAYGEFLASIDTWMQLLCTSWVERVALGQTTSELEARGLVVEEEVQRAQSRVVLLGPDPVRACAAQYHHAVIDRIEATQAAGSIEAVARIDLKPLTEARALMLAVMNRSLGLGPDF